MDCHWVFAYLTALSPSGNRIPLFHGKIPPSHVVGIELPLYLTTEYLSPSHLRPEVVGSGRGIQPQGLNQQPPWYFSARAARNLVLPLELLSQLDGNPGLWNIMIIITLKEPI